MSKKFIRTRENFVCCRCGKYVRGNGYTNHCPACLWSRHVDLNPGDRRARCGGMMEPESLEWRGGVGRVDHRCRRCGVKRVNGLASGDNWEAVIRLAGRPGRLA